MPLCNPCPDCDGPAIDFGFGAGDGRCSACHGTGSDLVPDILPGQDHDCYNCHGTGQCPTCHGKGYVDDGTSNSNDAEEMPEFEEQTESSGSYGSNESSNYVGKENSAQELSSGGSTWIWRAIAISGAMYLLHAVGMTDVILNSIGQQNSSNAPKLGRPAKLLPLDHGSRIPDFDRFRTALLEAVDRRDADHLVGILGRDIKLSFGMDSGPDRFIEMWNPYSPDSKVWRELNDILRLGGTFEYGNSSKDIFWAPYVFRSFPTNLDGFADAAITGEGVQVRTGPSTKAPVIASVSYDLVKLVADFNLVEERIGEFSYPWKKIELPDTRVGYVYGKYVRSPTNYRAAFEKIDGDWKLVFFASGD